jgi:peptidoglycan/xylan/chitin deacetylase (PgdA/CDA1 family)
VGGVKRVLDRAAVRVARPFALSVVRTTGRGIALTFDDGPDPATTLPLLEALEDTPATFFALGSQVRRWPQVVGRAAEWGHQVESHGDAHERTTRMTAAATEADLLRSWTSIGDAAGTPPRFYRPPHGLFSLAAWRGAARLAMRPTLWTTSSRDWEPGATAEAVTARVLAAARPGAIILLHDAGGPPGHARARVTVAAVPGILAGLRELGLTPVTISALLEDEARVPVD